LIPDFRVLRLDLFLTSDSNLSVYFCGNFSYNFKNADKFSSKNWQIFFISPPFSSFDQQRRGRFWIPLHFIHEDFADVTDTTDLMDIADVKVVKNVNDIADISDVLDVMDIMDTMVTVDSVNIVEIKISTYIAHIPL
jgi:hypothetical protein